MKLCSFDTKYIDEIHNIESVVFPDCYSLDTLNSVIDNKLYKNSLVLIDNDILVAYIIVYEVAKEAEIHRIAVNPVCRKKGYGKALISECIENLKSINVEKIHLEVRKSNVAAISLYKKFGFELIGVRKGYYSDNNDDAMLYTLQLC